MNIYLKTVFDVLSIQKTEGGGEHVAIVMKVVLYILKN